MRLPLTILALLAALAPVSAQQIDRIVAVVNQRPIAQSEWEQQERFEAMTSGAEWHGVQRSPEALERLIDRSLILEQMRRANFAPPTTGFVAAQLSQLRQQLKLEDDAAWRQRLKQYGLLEADVADVVGEQAQVLLFVDARFRPAVQVGTDEIARYYRETYLPEFRRTAKPGTPPPTPAQVQSQIATVLTEQRINELFASWLKALKQQANIRRPKEPAK